MIMSIGHKGFLQLGAKAFDNRMYGELDFPEFLRVRKFFENLLEFNLFSYISTFPFKPKNYIRKQ